LPADNSPMIAGEMRGQFQVIADDLGGYHWRRR
jgi:hypothetical protein